MPEIFDATVKIKRRGEKWRGRIGVLDMLEGPTFCVEVMPNTKPNGATYWKSGKQVYFGSDIQRAIKTLEKYVGPFNLPRRFYRYVEGDPS